MRCRSFFLWEASYIKLTNHWMPPGKIQRQKICSFKICLEAIGIRHLCWGDDSPAWDKKTTGEIIPSIQMNPGIEPSNVALNTLLLCSHGMKAAARTDRGFACSSERAGCAEKHKWFASCLPLGSAAPPVIPWGCFGGCTGSKVSSWICGGSCGPTQDENHGSPCCCRDRRGMRRL